MGTKIDYPSFLKILDERLKQYFFAHKENIFCKKGCSDCCEKGDYPISNIELDYLIQGYAASNNNIKKEIQNNIKSMQKGGKCPFLINKECSVYNYRPIVCRVHGLAYLLNNGMVKVPYCTNDGKNYRNNYSSGEFIGEPVKEDLETYAVLNEFFSETDFVIKNLYDWLQI